MVLFDEGKRRRLERTGEIRVLSAPQDLIIHSTPHLYTFSTELFLDNYRIIVAWSQELCALDLSVL